MIVRSDANARCQIAATSGAHRVGICGRAISPAIGLILAAIIRKCFQFKYKESCNFQLKLVLHSINLMCSYFSYQE